MNDGVQTKVNDEWMVPVKMIDPSICMTCPDLDVENQQMEMWYGERKTYTNRIVCRHYERCKLLLESLKAKDTH